MVPGGIGCITFASTMHDAAGEIYVRNFSGGSPIRLTNNAVPDDHPAWSPDGSNIAFTSDRDGNHDIYVIETDASIPTRLTSNPGSDQIPSRSPDGSKIAFGPERDGDWDIFMMNADGSDVGHLTDTTHPRFIDVPATHTFYDDVEWLAGKGITRGCNPPANDHYCPDANVTRAQMAAFLHRALG